MHKHSATIFALGLVCVLATACTFPGVGAAPTALLLLPTSTVLPPATSFPSPIVPATTALTVPTLLAGTAIPDPFVPQGAATQVIVPRAVETQIPSETFCADTQPTTLINSLKTALQTANGTGLASLVSPTHGMDARLYRNGRIVNYDQQHAKFLFESTYSVDWGPAPGSGQETMGSFHHTFIPDLLDVFNKSYTLTCNQVQVGGASYQATWPYSGFNYYSVYYPGSGANGSNDWHTWLLGMQYVHGKPYLYAIMQFKWEP